ncbi:TRAP transporter substrate-binding protein [Oscillibacter sp.]|uniref:TRAP transporter substrate-binding protein n=1 Tax=Oscillibacter sp. TaxID=1945593 RepID=UPI002632DEBA|nr:TRAP transporter substrate-binding protein [Oscillibacter sp.]MDD3347201.1 TRAP transporter substrate-binding protein [Oscillibacter sp.]
MKRFLVLALTLTMILSMTGCGSKGEQPSTEAPAQGETNTADDSGEKEWGEAENTWLSCISSNLLDGEHPFYQAQVFFDQCLREETNNKYGLDIYVGGQLGSDSEMVEGCLNGTYEFVLNSSGLFANISDDFNIFDLPYLFSSNEHAYAVMDSEIGQSALDSLEQYGMIGLGYGESGFRNITSSFQINTPADMKGMKLRTMDVPMHIEYFNMLGANATPMAMTEVFTSLQQGTIDGHENLSMGILSNRIYEVNPYIAVSEHIYTPIVYAMNADYFNSLPTEDQEAIRRAAARSIEMQRPDAQRQNNKALEIMEKDYGVTVTRVDKAPFMAVADEMYAKHPEYSDLVAQIRAADPANT